MASVIGSPPRRVRTFRHPALSLLQSAVHRVLEGRSSSPERAAGAGLATTAEHPVMQAAADAAAAHADEHREAKTARGRERERTCAHLYARLAIARFHGDAEESARLESEVRYLTCDPLWVEALLEYERALVERKKPFYRRHQQMDDFVLSTLPDEATVALIADWGTGMPDARGLLAQVASFSPDAVVHLGDIYYSGTPHEMRAHFLDPFAQVFGERGPQVYSLAGNHDRYSGGRGYETLLDALHQPASYFCLRNRYWQLIAMDTGLHDANPRALAHTATRLEDTEAAWVVDKIQRAADGQASRRGTLLLSHHPYFSLAGVVNDPQAGLLALNPHLARSLGPALDDVAAWFWGHEHDLLLYEPYAGLARGRCIGAGAVPLLVHEKVREAVPGLVPAPGEDQPPRTIAGTELGDDGEVMNHAYAILELRGPELTVRYYQAEYRTLWAGVAAKPGPPLYEESLTAPNR